MNNSTYIFGKLSDNGLFQYPGDYTNSIFGRIEEYDGDVLYIHRSENLMYYSFLRNIGNGSYLGISVVFNDVYLTSEGLRKLIPFFENCIKKIAEDKLIFDYNQLGDITPINVILEQNQEKIDALLSGFNDEIRKLDDFSEKLPPLKYSISNDEEKNFSNLDAIEEIVEASYTYSNTFIYIRNEDNHLKKIIAGIYDVINNYREGYKSKVFIYFIVFLLLGLTSIVLASLGSHKNYYDFVKEHMDSGSKILLAKESKNNPYFIYQDKISIVFDNMNTKKQLVNLVDTNYCLVPVPSVSNDELCMKYEKSEDPLFVSNDDKIRFYELVSDNCFLMTINDNSDTIYMISDNNIVCLYGMEFGDLPDSPHGKISLNRKIEGNLLDTHKKYIKSKLLGNFSKKRLSKYFDYKATASFNANDGTYKWKFGGIYFPKLNVNASSYNLCGAIDKLMGDVNDINQGYLTKSQITSILGSWDKRCVSPNGAYTFVIKGRDLYRLGNTSKNKTLIFQNAKGIKFSEDYIRVETTTNFLVFFTVPDYLYYDYSGNRIK
ncbi:MAG: hypothetical protein IKR18_05510 [Bacteroidaceae bacterium]|nr:hypothetical protein [Bacteroidaceae bacterium]